MIGHHASAASAARGNYRLPDVRSALLRRVIEQIQAMKADDPSRLAALSRLEQHFDDLPIGTSVIVHLATGAFASGASGIDVLKDFVKVNGTTVEAYMFEVGTPMFVGGGI